jgi:hypothetical protein
MQKKKSIRRSQLISPWGVGSMINFPGDESLMTCGLDIWEFANEECPDEIKITEERLQKRLGVSHFRLPPEFKEPGAGVSYANVRIPFVRFPRWHYCPVCGSMEKLSIYGGKQRCKGPNYSSGRSCHDTAPNKRPYLIPVRFIAICSKGHIEDFPFMEWVHEGNNYDDGCYLRLRSLGSTSSLGGIKIECSCGDGRTMAGAFNENSLSGLHCCSGSRPWLGEIDEHVNGCGLDLKVVQRGASNVYFADTRSSIYLPKWGNTVDRRIIEVLDNNWDRINGRRVDGKLDKNYIEMLAEIKSVDPEKLYIAAQKRVDDLAGRANSDETAETSDSEELHRKDEYDAIVSGLGGDNQDFYVVNKDMREYGMVIQEYFKSISLIQKLRETRAFVGFSRVLPEDGRTLNQKKKDLHLGRKINWLPAIVVKGEGIFFEFRKEKLQEWMENSEIEERVDLLVRQYNKSIEKRGQEPKDINPRFILFHTFAHIIINQLSYECGYGSSSLRERIYCNLDFKDKEMNGVLIYTASGDSEGSLGGLVRQGLPGNLENIIISALDSAQWCSGDPICMDSKGQGPDSCNLAACHNCTLLPETCCETGNRLLDRVLLVGNVGNRDAGYFSSYDTLD